MNRKEMLRLLINQARFNGFEFRVWFTTRLNRHWPGSEAALDLLAKEGRDYTLLFSHEFAQSFWRAGAQLRFAIPHKTYQRVTTAGDVVEITRKPYMRRTIKRDSWKYHLGQMALAEDPLAYISRFLNVELPDWEDAPPNAPLAAQSGD